MPIPGSGYCGRHELVVFGNEANTQHQTFTLVAPADRQPAVLEIIHEVSVQLAFVGLSSETVRWNTDTTNFQGKTLVFFLEYQCPFPPDMSAEKFEALRTMMLNSTRVLWVAMGNCPAMLAAMGWVPKSATEQEYQP
ncbi:hypothetical protein BDW59DRAFT_150191 [Aspergillus cavernicola]|uniref:Uncharacterized protein n=1 Tax=Aspergillus cavernicola TaxID=176166 RepID=A0ABR4I165_9EURO